MSVESADSSGTAPDASVADPPPKADGEPAPLSVHCEPAWVSIMVREAGNSGPAHGAAIVDSSPRADGGPACLSV